MPATSVGVPTAALPECSTGLPSTGRRVSSPGQRRQHHTVPLTTPQLDDEQRLAALWEHDVDDDGAHTASHDDARATLFATARDTATAAHTTRPRRRRSARPQQSRRRTRPPRRAQPRRLAGAAISALAALTVVIVIATDGTPSGTPSYDTAKPSPQAVRTAPTPTTPAHVDRHPERTGATRRRTRTSNAPQEAERPKRRPAQTSRADRNTPHDRPSRHAAARAPAARPSRPPAPPPVPPPVATSSACDEFPPC